MSATRTVEAVNLHHPPYFCLMLKLLQAYHIFITRTKSAADNKTPATTTSTSSHIFFTNEHLKEKTSEKQVTRQFTLSIQYVLEMICVVHMEVMSDIRKKTRILPYH